MTVADLFWDSKFNVDAILIYFSNMIGEIVSLEWLHGSDRLCTVFSRTIQKLFRDNSAILKESFP